MFASFRPLFLRGIMLVFVLLFASPAGAQSLAVDSRCTLSKAVSMSARKKGKGKKKRVKAGTRVRIVALQKGWAQIAVGKRRGYVKRSLLNKLCRAKSTEEDPFTEAARDAPFEREEEAAAQADPSQGNEEDEGTDDDATMGGRDDSQDEDPDDDSASEDGGRRESDKGRLRVGGALVFGTEIERPGLRGDGYVTLDKVLEGFRVGGDLTFFFPRSGITLFTLNGNALYSFFRREPWSVHALAGINIAHARGNGASATEFGLNLGVGGEYDLGFADVYADAKYIISDFDQLVLGAGLRWALDVF